MSEPVQIHTIVEMGGSLMPMSDLFPNLGDALDADRATLESEGAVSPDGFMIAEVRSFVVRAGGRTVVVDTGVGNDKDRPGGHPSWHKKTDTAWMDGLAAAGASPEAVDLVICTHLHVDHVGWNTRLDGGRWVPTFPNARYLIGRAEYEHWAGANAQTPNPVFIDSVLPVMEAGLVNLVDSDAELAPLLRFLPTPGHTPGHCSVLVDGGKSVIAGDVLHSPIQFRHPEQSLMFDSDMAQAAATRRALLERFAGTGSAVYFTHPPACPVTIARDGDRFSYRPA